MKALSRVLTLAAPLVAAACASTPPPPQGTGLSPPPPPPPPSGDLLPDWRAVIQQRDLSRLQRLNAAWVAALADVRRAGKLDTFLALGPVADQAAALPRAMPPAGNYRCRTIKVGTGVTGYIAYDWFRCRIERNERGHKFSKVTGSQNPSGMLFPDNNRRAVFLGSVAMSGEPPPTSYGLERTRDMVAAVERVGERTWRMAVPWPQTESRLDLIELTPE